MKSCFCTKGEEDTIFSVMAHLSLERFRAIKHYGLQECVREGPVQCNSFPEETKKKQATKLLIREC